MMAPMQTFVRRALLTIIFIIPLVSLVVTSTLFMPFVTGKAFLFRFLIELATGLWLLLIFCDKEYYPRRSWLMMSFVLLLAVTVLSNVVGVHPSRSFWGDFNRMGGFITLGHVGLYFLILSSTIKTGRLWHRFFIANVVASIGVIAVAIGQWMKYLPLHRDISEMRLEGTFGNAGFLASYILLHIFFVLLLMWWKRGQPLTQFVLSVILFLYGIVLYQTATRGALIALIIALVGTALFFIFTTRKTYRARLGLVIGSCCLCIIGIIFFLAQDSTVNQNNITLQRLHTLSISNIRNESRYYLWTIAWQSFKDHPLLGWGQENFYYAYYQHYQPELYNENEGYNDRAHNFFLDQLVTGGIVGLIAYVLLFSTVFYMLWGHLGRKNFSRAEQCLITGFFIAYFINNSFTFDTMVTYLPVYTIFAFIQNTSYKTASDLQQENTSRKGLPFAYILIIGATIFGIYYLNVRAWITTRNFTTGLTLFPQNAATSYQIFSETLVQAPSFNLTEIRRELLIMLADQKRMAQSDPTSRSRFIILAESEINKQLAQRPFDPLFLYVAGSFLSNEKKYTEALIALERAQTISPQQQSILLKLVEVYIDMKEYAHAFQIAKETFELAPQFDTPRLVYAATALYTGRGKIASELIELTPQSVRMHNNQLLRAYIETGHMDQAISILEYRANENKNDTQAYISLAAAYFMVGRKNEAIQLVRHVMNTDPQLQKIGTQWINQMEQGIIPGE